MNIGFWSCIILVIPFLIIGVLFAIFKEKAAKFVSGFNSFSKEEQALYDKAHISRDMNCSPLSRQLKKYKFFLPAEIYLLAVFMQLASKFRVFPLVLKFRDSFASVYCCSNLYNLRSVDRFIYYLFL